MILHVLIAMVASWLQRHQQQTQNLAAKHAKQTQALRARQAPRKNH